MRQPWTLERVRAARNRGWKRYVDHFGHAWAPGSCHYGTSCRISTEQNGRDARLAGLELRVRPQQLDLGL